MFVRLNYDKEIKLIFRRMSFNHKFEDGFALFFNLGCHRWKTVAARFEAPSYVLDSGEGCCTVKNINFETDLTTLMMKVSTFKL